MLQQPDGLLDKQFRCSSVDSAGSLLAGLPGELGQNLVTEERLVPVEQVEVRNTDRERMGHEGEDFVHSRHSQLGPHSLIVKVVSLFQVVGFQTPNTVQAGPLEVVLEQVVDLGREGSGDTSPLLVCGVDQTRPCRPNIGAARNRGSHTRLEELIFKVRNDEVNTSVAVLVGLHEPLHQVLDFLGIVGDGEC